ncbi:LPS assembly lipoprotein LptE [Candidatus Palibaumannia cicadellinicola]|uniref:LPS-assembly lipoprotein RlpB (Rare lipoprotein B) n=1 Tax=Candidatus Palibaumannia cicadellinicola TaxID=186490 RepID=A0A088MXQ7_9GAMM|nr:LPS assembly lipoprotein LptE [Candidatus Baumannia cicadellinicola]AIN47145.1 LPS-assembly lipoprotein RlpB precursor (Rare lipoprotein B) [Candidatus Baumannia cicadellinicola]
MHINDITIHDDTNSPAMPSLYILNSSESKVTISVFQDGKTAGYQIKFFMPNKDYYPINIKVYRTLFDNPLMALAKNEEEDMIRQEMHQQASQQLVHQLLLVLQHVYTTDDALAKILLPQLMVVSATR